MEERVGTVYGLSSVTEPAKGIRYVGITFRKPAKRLAEHRREAARRKDSVGPRSRVYRWMWGQGTGNIRMTVLQEMPECTQEELLWAETLWIRHYATFKHNLFNVQSYRFDPTASRK